MSELTVWKYKYEILVKSVSLSLPASIKVFIIVACDHKKTESKARLTIDKTNTIANFNETFDLIVNIQKSQNHDGFNEKKAKIGVYALSSLNKVKVLGECMIDLAAFASDSTPILKVYKFQNCIDKNATIELEIKSQFIETVQAGSIKFQSPIADSGEGSGKSSPSTASPEPSHENNSLVLKKPMPSTIKQEELKSSKFGIKLQKPDGSRVLLKEDEDKVWKTKFQQALKEKEEWIEKHNKLQEHLNLVEKKLIKEDDKTQVEASTVLKLRKELEDSKNDNAELLRKVNQYQTEISSENTQSTDEINSLKKELETYKNNNDELTNKIEELEKLNSTLTPRIKSLEEECKKGKEGESGYKKLIKEHKSRLEENQEVLEKYKEENSQLMNKINLLEADKRESGQLLLQVKELEEKNNEIAKLKNKIHSLENKHKEDVKKLEESLRDYENEQQQLASQISLLEESEKENKKLKEELNSNKKVLEETKRQYQSKLSNEEEKHKQKLNTLEAEYNKQALEITMLNKTINSLKGEVQESSSKTDSLLDDYKKEAERQMEELRERIKAKEDLLKEKEAEVNELNGKLEQAEDLSNKSKEGIKCVKFRMGEEGEFIASKD